MSSTTACRIPTPLRCVALAALLATTCGRGRAAPGGPPPMNVEAVTLQEQPVERMTEFVGTVRSRRSATVQPQVEGFVTRILKQAGDRVEPGTVLLEIDPRVQQAAVSNLESQRAARQAEVVYARQQAERLKTLLAAGASSQAEMEQAQTALETSEAQLKALEAQINQQRVTLAYHQVKATVSGVLGDIPVRVGDSVTRSTVLTTIDQNAGLEVYIHVPVQQASMLKEGLPVHLVDDAGRRLATESITFVSPSVDAATQSVLAKSDLSQAAGFRTEQYVRAQIVWDRSPALTVPLVSLNRINGQYFAYVVEPGQGGGTVARQRSVQTGPVVGNDYVITSGLKPGEKLIVSGVQKIRDGAPVNATAPAPPPTDAPVPTGQEKAG
ncbi:MAG TPA: efflux RND transporter periplasmic adaptor subunit [Vicinamibacteria bacterium]|nr:efflux RND transporter periplasmic adaptor subunit [Vicinamibacteria bacterium]